jgi:hypothetical protein
MDRTGLLKTFIYDRDSGQLMQMNNKKYMQMVKIPKSWRKPV